MPEPLSLFPELEPGATVPAEKESADRRRTRRQREAIAAGVHPLGLLYPAVRLHPDAPRPAGPEDRAPGPRCGGCCFRRSLRWHDGSFPKCTAGGGDRVTHGGGTDVRAWWPACTDFENREDS